jgi:hypothetical protein
MRSQWFCALCDGSFKDTFVSIITNGSDLLNVVPGHPDDQGAYRSELAGLYGIVLVVNWLCEWAGLTTGKIEVGCDGLSALNKAFDSWPLEPQDPHFDMLSAIRHMIQASPLQWTTRHIAGHQDNDATLSLIIGLCRTFKWTTSQKSSGCNTLILLRFIILLLTKVFRSGSAIVNCHQALPQRFLITSMVILSLLGTRRITGFLLAMSDGSIGMYVRPLFTGSH